MKLLKCFILLFLLMFTSCCKNNSDEKGLEPDAPYTTWIADE